MNNPYAPPSSGGRPVDGTTEGPDGGPEQPGPTEPRRPPVPVAPVPRRPPDPEAVTAASRRVMHFGLLLLASLLTASLPLPWQVAGLVFAVAAVVMGVRALRAVWRAGMRGALVPVLTMMLVLAAALSTSLAAALALWPLEVDRQACLRDALTISARETCDQQFQDAVTERLTRATNRLG